MNHDSEYRSYFERAKAVCAMILEAQDDLKQLKADAREELITDDTSQADAKQIKADLSEVFAIAMIEAKGEQERKKQAEKIERRQRMAEVVGVQLGFEGIAPSTPVTRMAKASSFKRRVGKVLVDTLHDKIAKGEVSIEAGSTRIEGDGQGGVSTVKTDAHDPETGEIHEDEPDTSISAPIRDDRDRELADTVAGMQALRGTAG